MKPRLFWTMLLAFALVIVLGICGMLGFFGLALAGIWQPAQAAPDGVQEIEVSYAASLGDYYAANGNSWAGVDQRMHAPPFALPGAFFGYALADEDGRIVASSDRSLPVGRVVDAKSLARGVPVQARGERVGTLVLRTGPHFGAGPQMPEQAAGRPPADFVGPVVRSFMIAGLILAGALLLLAVVFAQRLSRPLRDITQAAQHMAGGQLDVQVRRAPIRELDELSQSFNAMARSIAEADRQRKQMTADIAHELRTPLTIIKGRLEGLQDGVYTATPEELERLLHEIALLERLIEDLRLLALAEAGQLPLYREPIDPRTLLATARAAFAGQARSHDVTLAIDAPVDLPPIDADPQRMTQVLANLVSNALRYTPPGGTITLSATLETKDQRPKTESPQSAALVPGSSAAQETKDQRPKTKPLQPAALVPAPSSLVILRVRDTGRGIPAEDLPHVFDRFYRADRSRARGSGGAGLGLAIAKQIVAAHGGEIWAESEEGNGTTIGIALPAEMRNEEELIGGSSGSR